MKTILLLLTGLLINITTVSAENLSNNNNTTDVSKHYRFAQPISFIERGVEFFIFPDGSFDYDLNRTTYYGSNSKRSTINASYNGPRISVNYSSSVPMRTNISRDRNGNIRSINNIVLNYDRYGKISRVGSVHIDYGRGKNGTLSQVGNLKVNYNRWGEIASVRGFVNQNNRFVTYNLRKENDYASNNSRYDNDDNYYYYKQNGNIKKQKKR
ncbi:hypothetical protein [Mariniflexile sp.]|uniref:hypothetical protein n=1 Tax=Mariniflexile sp. TaxID=1979402 RepID=UPI003567DC66